MEHKDFTIGQEFLCGEKRWRCTDKGTRVIVAIALHDTIYVSCDDGKETRRVRAKEDAEADGWFKGPPYAVEEVVFDEEDIEGCEAA